MCVAAGRHAGQMGTVVSSGNGWVQIETSVGEVAKRSYELQVVSANSSGSGNHHSTYSSASHHQQHYRQDGGGEGRSSKRARTSGRNSRYGGGGGGDNDGDDAQQFGSFGNHNSTGAGAARGVSGSGRLYLNIDAGSAFSTDDTTLLLNLAGNSNNMNGSDGMGSIGLDSRGRKRPRAYSDSLMTLSPTLLGNGRSFGGGTGGLGLGYGFSFRARDSSSSSASASSSAVSGFLSSLPHDGLEDDDDSSLRNRSYLHSNRALLTNHNTSFNAGSGDHHSITTSSTHSNSSSYGGSSSSSSGGGGGSSARGVPLKSSAVIDGKRTFISKYVARHLQKIDGRPNLVDWKQQLDATLVNNALFERQAARMFEEAHCDVCSVEKWPGAKFCWNEGCPISPVYFKLTGAARVAPGESAAAAATVRISTSSTSSSSANNTQVDATATESHTASSGSTTSSSTGSSRSSAGDSQFSPEKKNMNNTNNAAALQYQHQQHHAVHLQHNGPVPSLVTDYLLNLPAHIIGAPMPRSGIARAFSSHTMTMQAPAAASSRSSSSALTSSNGSNSLVQPDGHVMYMVQSGSGGNGNAAPDYSYCSYATTTSSSSSSASYASLSAARDGGGAGGNGYGSGSGGAYTQYYYSQRPLHEQQRQQARSRGDSFAGGETDSEVAASPITLPDLPDLAAAEHAVSAAGAGATAISVV